MNFGLGERYHAEVAGGGWRVVLAEEANRTSNRNRCTKKQLRRVGSEKGTSPMMVAMAALTIACACIL